MSKIKQIILTPLNKFFFGGENFFDAEEGVFYFQTSRDFPQQTTLLGVIRHQILLQNNLMDSNGIKDETTATTWIGAESFSPNTTRHFGKIQQLSPAFISKNGAQLQPNWRAKIEVDDPKDPEEKKKIIVIKPFSFSNSQIKASFHSQAKQDISVIENYSEKGGIEKGFLDIATKTFYLYKDVYDKREEPQIGINKMDRYRNNMTDDEGFYKFKYCRLKEGFAFSFYVEVAHDVELEDAIITMGKERSPFKMEVKDANEIPFQKADIQQGSKIVLLSDANVPNEIYDHCDAIISDTISFRNFGRKVSKTDNYAARPKTSSRLNLLKRGSILQISKSANIDSVKKLLQNDNFRTIGYNFYTNY